MEMATKRFPEDLTQATWFKSSKSGPNCDNCVEVAYVIGAVGVRDSKDKTGPALVFRPRGMERLRRRSSERRVQPTLTNAAWR